MSVGLDLTVVEVHGETYCERLKSEVPVRISYLRVGRVLGTRVQEVRDDRWGRVEEIPRSLDNRPLTRAPSFDDQYRSYPDPVLRDSWVTPGGGEGKDRNPTTLLGDTEVVGLVRDRRGRPLRDTQGLSSGLRTPETVNGPVPPPTTPEEVS